MAGRSRLTSEQMAELRTVAQRARADTRHRGFGNTRGRVGRNATEVLVDWLADAHGIHMSLRGMQALLNRIGLEYRHNAWGGVWSERRQL
jgi:hypothetical protein